MNDTDNIMITTLDNPFNPFTQWDEWNRYDMDKGYFTCAYLARITKSSDELSEVEESSVIINAINEILDLNILGIYIKVSPETFESRFKDRLDR